jgi:hypothetical protein
MQGNEVFHCAREGLGQVGSERNVCVLLARKSLASRESDYDVRSHFDATKRTTAAAHFCAILDEHQVHKTDYQALCG